MKKRFSLDWIEGLEFEKIDKWTDREKIIASGQVHYLCIELNMERSIATLTVEGVVLDRFTVKLEGGEEDGADLKLYALTLKVGDYLLFEEVRSPSSSDDNNNSNNSIEDIAAPIPTELSSSPPPPDPLHRHVVRFTKVESYAPQAFRRQERAVIESDYVEVLRKHPEVQRASVAFRWFGSWYTVLLTIDRFGGKKVDEAFRYRLAGLDMEINEPHYIPLYIKLGVCVSPNYFRDKVEKVLLEIFSNRDLPDGRRGFFHSDNFTFGQSVYLSKIYELAMKVDGVSSVIVTDKENFRRLDRRPEKELDEEVIRMEPVEVARVDNDHNYPDNGRIEFDMEGGR